MTNREFFSAIVSANLSDEITAKATTLLAQMDKERATTNARNATKRATENEPIIQAILALLSDNQPRLTTEVATEVGVSASKASGVLRNLLNEGKVKQSDVKVKGKGVQKSWTVTLSVEPIDSEDSLD